jgi:hypothetical protein
MRKGQRKGAGRVAFLAHIEDIRTALERGHTVKAVHQQYGPLIPIGYAQFARHVNALVRKKESQTDTRLPETRVADTRLNQLALPFLETVPPSREVAVEANKVRDSSVRRFVFDPTAADRKKLI